MVDVIDKSVVIARLEDKYAETAKIWQYDYGRVLRLICDKFPQTVEVDFSLYDKAGDTITRVGTTVDGVTEVKIP